MAAGRGDFERALGGDLSPHVRKVVGALGLVVAAARADAKLAAVAEHDRDRVGQRADRIDVDPLDERCLIALHLGHDDRAQPRALRGDRHRQHAGYGPQAAVERELEQPAA